jgi:hypothetical protein
MSVHETPTTNARLVGARSAACFITRQRFVARASASTKGDR